MLSKQEAQGAACFGKLKSPMGLLFSGDCESQQKLFLWLAHVQELCPMRILWRLITCEVMPLFPHLGCLQGFSPLPSF